MHHRCHALLHHGPPQPQPPPPALVACSSEVHNTWGKKGESGAGWGHLISLQSTAQTQLSAHGLLKPEAARCSHAQQAAACERDAPRTRRVALGYEQLHAPGATLGRQRVEHALDARRPAHA